MRTIEDLKNEDCYRLVKTMVQFTGIHCKIYVNNSYYSGGKPVLYFVCNDQETANDLYALADVISDEDPEYDELDRYGVFLTSLLETEVSSDMILVEEV